MSLSAVHMHRVDKTHLHHSTWLRKLHDCFVKHRVFPELRRWSDLFEAHAWILSAHIRDAWYFPPQLW